MGDQRRKKLVEINKKSPQGNLITKHSEDGIIDAIAGRTIVTFLQPAFDCCSEKCIIEFTPNFSANGYGVLCVPQDKFQDILKYMSNYVVLFRTGYMNASPPLVESIGGYVQHIRSLGIRVVYYADDFIFLMNNKAPLALLSKCDAVIVATEPLKKYLVEQCGVTIPIIVVRTHIDLTTIDSLEETSFPDFQGRTRVLFSSGGRIGINHIYEICEIANEDPSLYKDIQWIFNSNGVAQIRSIINKFRNLHKTYIDWVSLKEYYSLYKSVDIVIHPSRNDDLTYLVPPEHQDIWLDSKSEVKYTLAGASGNPIIASPSFSYRASIKPGVNGFLAHTTEEFITFIRLLKDHPNVRDEIGAAARKDVENRYDINKRFPEYLSAIIGQSDNLATAITNYTYKNTKKVFIPPIQGGPRSFYENMVNWLPSISSGKWEVTQDLSQSDIAIAIAFVAAQEIIEEKKKRGIKIIYRLDGLPMDFEGNLEPSNLKIMQEMFRYADVIVWQSEHCRKMWRDRNLVPPEINPEGPIIHNGVDTSLFKTDGTRYPLSKGDIKILHMNWSTFQHKRIDLLEAIVKKAQKETPNLHFYTLGNYGSTNPITSLNFWKDYNNVTYLGSMRNQSKEAKETIASIDRAVDSMIFTSEMEGSPNTVLEVTACGKPIFYNSSVDIVPEICGKACIGWFTTEDFLNVIQKPITFSSILDDKFKISTCIKQYLEQMETL